MAITKSQKKEILEKIIEKIKKANSLLFVGYEGLKINDQEKLRKKLKEANGEFFVVKKTLLNLALKEFKFEGIENLKLDKEVAIVLSYKDEIEPFKITFNFSKENENLKIKGGIFENKIIGLEEVKALASLPSKEVLKGQLLSVIRSPLSNLIYVLESNLRNFIYLLDFVSKTK